MDINYCMISGNLVRDPDIRYTKDERKMCIAHFTLGCNSNPKAEKDSKNAADYPQFVAFDKTAEWIEKRKKEGKMIKGSECLVISHVNTGSYEKDGIRIYTTDFTVDQIKLIGPSSGDEPAFAPAAPFKSAKPETAGQKEKKDEDDFVQIDEEDPENDIFGDSDDDPDEEDWL